MIQQRKRGYNNESRTKNRTYMGGVNLSTVANVDFDFTGAILTIKNSPSQL